MSQKTVADAGADQRTPSVPQYFSWINNTNEGSTEAQTLTNLEFFAWLNRTYGMEIKIYAWDAGNFDGSAMGYGDPDGEKFRTQYPNGYGPIVEKAREYGIRLGLWGSPDGFGDTPEEQQKRYDFMVDLCRKHRFALFKVDGVCGVLRPEKAGVFAQMLRDCRKYSPDLIVLNHRLDLYEAEKHATTFLWQGAETYVDVHSANHDTCMHHRGFIFDRGLPDNLERLAEDHGVCISSSVAYFEDDLIYQAFGRSMILAPEIYGNPWLMRDDEYPKLARVYNLHKAWAPILVEGVVLPASYGHSPVSRGTKEHRFIITGNNAWTSREITIRLDKEIGLDVQGEQIALIQRHPYEQLIGIFVSGETVNVKLMPFRAHLFEAAAVSKAGPVLENCAYEMLREDDNGRPVEVKLLQTPGGEVTLLDRGRRSVFGAFEKCDIREKVPEYLGTMTPDAKALTRAEELFEAAQFAIDNDSLEIRELRRAGQTAIPQVQASRDAFFSQLTYWARGCDGAYAFDGKDDTFFDGQSKSYRTGLRIDGGCLRVDFGMVHDADTVEIVCFEIDEPVPEVFAQKYTEKGTYSADLIHWQDTETAQIDVIAENITTPVVKFRVHTNFRATGKRVRVRYKLGKNGIRYFRLPMPMDRIHAIRLLKDGQEIVLENPRVSNLQPPYGAKKPVFVKSCAVTLQDVQDGEYLAVALNGVHGEEGAYCVAELGGQPIGFPDRAPAYQSNIWECFVCRRDRNCTYYLPLNPGMNGKTLTVRALFCNAELTEVTCDLWRCPRH